jgi:mono/diheme cytochrome c family protein
MRDRSKRVALLIVALLAGCRASTPGRVESSVAAWTKKHITVRGKDDRNPLQSDLATVRAGRAAFNHYCFVCHGLDGQNTGVPFAAKLDPPVPSLASPEVQQYTDGQLKWVIENGVAPSGMPASSGTLNDDEMWAIVIFLRHLPKQGSLGEPRVYQEDDDDAQK